MASFLRLKNSSAWSSWLILVLSLLVISLNAAAAPTEHEVKAAYLLNVLKFVQRTASPVDREILTVCLLTPGPVEQPLRALEGSVVSGRKLKIRLLQKDQDLRSCEVLFFGRSSGEQATLQRAKTLGLLTVGNDVAFVPMSGMVGLVVEGRRIIVEVNGEAVRNPDWAFSSHLLEIARVTNHGSLR